MRENADQFLLAPKPIIQLVKFQCFPIFSSNVICHIWSHPNKLLCVSREWGTLHLPYETLIFNKESKFSVILESRKCSVPTVLSTYIPLFLPSSPVSLSYLNLAVPMRKGSGEHSCTSSTFSIAILNGTCPF